MPRINPAVDNLGKINFLLGIIEKRFPSEAVLVGPWVELALLGEIAKAHFMYVSLTSDDVHGWQACFKMTYDHEPRWFIGDWEADPEAAVESLWLTAGGLSGVKDIIQRMKPDVD